MKTLEEFSSNRVNHDGLSHMCKECCCGYRLFLKEQKQKTKPVKP